MQTRHLRAPGALLAALLVAAAPLAAGSGGSLQPIGGVRFTHTADAENTDGYATFLDHPLVNQNQDAVIVVTQNWNPKGSAGVYNDHPIGVYFDPNLGGSWAIYNEDIAAIPEGASFNVLVLPAGPDAMVHTTSSGNNSGNTSVIGFPAAYGDPLARIFLTHNYNPSGFSGTVHELATGVYSEDADWLLYNENLASMAEDLHFNLSIGAPDARTVLHHANPGNIDWNTTYLDHPDLNGNPGAWVLVTHNWGVEGVVSSDVQLANGGVPAATGVYVDANLGVWYSESEGRWAIFDQAGEGGTMPENALFNVLVDPRPQLFADDFETGNHDRWSLVYPDDVISLSD